MKKKTRNRAYSSIGVPLELKGKLEILKGRQSWDEFIEWLIAHLHETCWICYTDTDALPCYEAGRAGDLFDYVEQECPRSCPHYKKYTPSFFKK